MKRSLLFLPVVLIVIFLFSSCTAYTYFPGGADEDFYIEETEAAADAVYADIHYVSSDHPEKSVRYYSSGVFRRWMMRFGMMPAHPSFYCRKAVYDQYGAFDTTYRIAADFEMLVRLLFIHRIRARYIKKDFVTMRLGGASTTGYGAWSLIMKEHLQIMKHHGVVTNRFLLSLRYIYKLFEFL